MEKIIISYKHSLGTYFNLITSINDKGLVEYEYCFNANYIYEPDKNELIEGTLNKESSKQFIEYIVKAKIEDMDREYYRLEQVMDNAPECEIALIKDSNSSFVYVEADSYPDTFKYIVKALNLINEDFTYWYKSNDIL